MDAKTLRAAADILMTMAAKAESTSSENPDNVNVWDGVNDGIPLPPGLVTDANRYGTRPDIGSPGWQIALRSYARQDGYAGNNNKYVRDRGLTPLWPDEKQPWEV